MKYNTLDSHSKGFAGTCLECSSENVKLSVDMGFPGSDVTGADEPQITIDCLDCKQHITIYVDY